jgi:hypothetical protein
VAADDPLTDVAIGATRVVEKASKAALLGCIDILHTRRAPNEEKDKNKMDEDMRHSGSWMMMMNHDES